MQPLNREKKMNLNKMKKAELVAAIKQLRAEIATLQDALELMTSPEPNLSADIESACMCWPHVQRPIPADLLASMNWSRCSETGHLKLRIARQFYIQNPWVRRFLGQFQEYARGKGHHAFLGRDSAGGFLRISAKPI